MSGAYSPSEGCASARPTIWDMQKHVPPRFGGTGGVAEMNLRSNAREERASARPMIKERRFTNRRLI